MTKPRGTLRSAALTRPTSPTIPILHSRECRSWSRALPRRLLTAESKRLCFCPAGGEDGAVASEESVQNSGVAWTIVRCNWFNQNFNESFFLGPVLDGVISLPAGDAVEPFVDAEDIADVAVAALTESGHDGQVYELSGPRLLGFHEVAREISAATGRDIVYSPVSAVEYETVLAKEGLPRDFVDLFTLILDGRNASLTDGVRRALGRDPKDFSHFAREAAATGIWDVAGESVAAGLHSPYGSPHRLP